MDIRNERVHKIKKHSCLYLEHRSFPYPPGQDYKWDVPDNVEVEIKCGYSSRLEGASRDETVYFNLIIVENLILN